MTQRPLTLPSPPAAASASTALLPTALCLDEVAGYQVEDFDRTGFLRLDINEDPRGAPPHLVAVCQALTPHGLATYPPPRALARALAHLCGVGEDEVLLCNGGDQGLELLLRAYLRSGATLLTHAPGFDMFPLWAALRGCPTRSLPMRALGPAHLVFDLPPFLAAIEELGAELGAVTLVTPNNPTGSAIPRAEIEAVLAALHGRVGRGLPPVPLIVDETYIDFGGVTVVDLVGREPWLFVQRSASKSAALAGVRLGWVLGPAAEVERLQRAAEPFRVNRLALEIGLRACSNEDGSAAAAGCLPDWWRRRVDDTLRCRAALAAGLGKLGLHHGAADANFLLVHVGPRHAEVAAALRADGILIRDRHGKHPLLDGCVRIGVGDAGQVARTLCALRKALRPPPGLSGLLMDMDGTLVDVRASCLWAIAETVRALLRAAGRDADAVQVDATMVDVFKARGGLNNDWDCEQAMLESFGVSVAYEAIVARHQALYQQAIAGEPWLLTVAGAAIARRWPLGVVTGRPRAEALYTLGRGDAPLCYLDRTIVDSYSSDGQRDDEHRVELRVVVGLEDMPRQKPAPDGLLQACAALGLPPAAVAYVGDAVDDMRAARAAGCTAIGVLVPGATWNDGGAERLALAGADVVCRDLEEALRWLAT